MVKCPSCMSKRVNNIAKVLDNSGNGYYCKNCDTRFRKTGRVDLSTKRDSETSSNTSLDQTLELLNSFDEKYDCRDRFDHFYLENSEGEKVDFRCKSWSCHCCSWRMRNNLVREVKRLGEERDMTRLMTLTLNPAHFPDYFSDKDLFEHLMKKWNKFRIYLQRKFGKVDFLWIVERQSNGFPHLHILVGSYIPFQWIKKTWSNIKAGKVADIRYVDAHRVGSYVGKYLTKDSVMEMPKGQNRYGCSGDIDLNVRFKSSSGDKWYLMVSTYDRLFGVVTEVDRSVEKVDFVKVPPKEKTGLDPPDPPEVVC